ncbi:MAG: hypothetical protein QF570_09410 [Myxococcota bacterium]|nr:hypothetical protein [Myxococcota bacterium]
MQSETLESIDHRSAVDSERRKQAVDEVEGEKKRAAATYTRSEGSSASSSSSSAASGSSQAQFASDAASTSDTAAGRKVDTYA